MKHMNRRMKLAYFCYLSNVIVFSLIGLTFVFAGEFFPFHSDIIQTSWGDLDTAAQTLYLGMMRTEGAGFLASAVAIGILFFIPFRRGEIWACWAMSCIGIVEHLPTLFANVYVSMTTAATPPWPIPLVGIILLIMGLVLAIHERQTNTAGQ